MITTATFLGYILITFLLAYLLGFTINGLFTLFKNVR
jgi:hypothetical protein